MLGVSFEFAGRAKISHHPPKKPQGKFSRSYTYIYSGSRPLPSAVHVVAANLFFNVTASGGRPTAADGFFPEESVYYFIFLLEDITVSAPDLT